MVDKYEDKDHLAENLLEKALYSNLVESEVENDADARKRIKEGVDNKKYSVVLAHDKYDHHTKLVFFALT